MFGFPFSNEPATLEPEGEDTRANKPILLLQVSSGPKYGTGWEFGDPGSSSSLKIFL